jgi:hypothetical protein
MTTTLTANEQYRGYRALVGTPADGLVYWWYAGVLVAQVEGLPPLPVIQATTLMVYRLETLGDASFAIHWEEVGYFTDFASGAPANEWLNPVTGRTVTAPRTFAEGPGRYLITRGADGLDIQQQQPGARIKSLALEWTRRGERLTLLQTERKIRGFPEQDGRLPEPDSASGFEACTRLAFSGDVLFSSAPTMAAYCGGSYDFRLAGFPPWLGMDGINGCVIVNGIICKVPPGVAQFAGATQTLKKLFPEFMARYGH